MPKIFSGKVVSLQTKKIKLPNGVLANFEIVGHPGGAAILPVFDNGDLLLIKQYRAVIGEYIWEIPAGKLEKGEKPLAAVKRELIEETGYRAGKIKKLGEIWTTPGFCQEKIYLYLARGLKAVPQMLEADEVITVHRFKVSEIKKMLGQGKITDSKTLCALMYYLNNW